MIQAYKNYWRNYAKFEGKSSRSKFWWVVLCNFLIPLPIRLIGLYFFVVKMLSLTIMDPVLMEQLSNEEAAAVFLEVFSAIAPFVIIGLIWFLVTLIPNLALEVRRYRDGGFSWTLIFLNLSVILLFIPVVGGLIWSTCQVARLVFLVQPSKAEPLKRDASALPGMEERSPYADTTQKLDLADEESSEDPFKEN